MNKPEYKVIGWTGWYDRRFADFDKSDGAYAAVLEEIRSHGYKFGSDKHENYVPVLNDGTAARFSRRGWGKVMAETWQPDNTDPNKYSLYYTTKLIDPATVKYPEISVRFSLISNRTVHKLPFRDAEFLENHYLCEKSLFIDLQSENLTRIKRGDFIDFSGTDGESLIGEAFVVHVYSTSTVPEIVDMMKRDLPMWKDLSEELGFGRKLTKEQTVNLLRKRISPDDEKRYGVWGAEIYYP